MASLNHQNIVTVDDFGENDGIYWLRMELASGFNCRGTIIRTLQQYMDMAAGCLPEDELVVILVSVLDALSHAHNCNMIHRDIKPANILFAEKGGSNQIKLIIPKLTDFGLVRIVGEEWLNSQIQNSLTIGNMKTMGRSSGSQAASLIGTYDYMSPEQKSTPDVDSRSDIYSVGMLAYRALTGKPFGFKRPSDINLHISKSWDEWIIRCLESDPNDRFQSAGDALFALSKVKRQIQLKKQGRLEPRREAEFAGYRELCWDLTPNTRSRRGHDWRCISCGTMLYGTSDTVGKKVKCKSCGQVQICP